MKIADCLMCGDTKKIMKGTVIAACPRCTTDPVNHPGHYTTGKIECIDFIVDQKLGYLEGQVVKYIVRARWKGAELEDLRKAEFYLKRAIREKDIKGFIE